jgi:phosphoglycolate phosphatase
MYKLWVFDLDGTLVDSARTVTDILNEKRSELGLPGVDVSALVPWLSLGGEQLVAQALELPLASAAEHVLDFRCRYLERRTPKESVYPGVNELLGALAERNKRIAVCTNKPRNLAEKVLAEVGLDRWVEFTCAGGDLPVSKPHVETLMSCLRRFAVSSSETLLVGDSTVDHRLASAAGVKFAFFQKGYDDGVSICSGDISISSHLQLKSMLSEGVLQ